MVSIAITILVLVLVHNQEINSFVLLEKDNNVLWNGEHTQRQTVDTKKPHINKLAALIQEITERLFQKRTELNNVLSSKEISYINRNSPKSPQTQIALSELLNEGQGHVLWNGEQSQRQTVDTKKPHNKELAALVKKITDRLFQKRTELNNVLSSKEMPHINRNSPKSPQTQIALSELLNEGQGFYKHIHKDLNDYSKVYLVLNPESNLSSSDVRDIHKLVSSLFPKTLQKRKATIKDHHKDKGIKRYKGFVIRDKRRRFKESQEKFAAKDSIENDYRPKRARGDYGGGGGRTAIPYVRHRGDIYEKD